MHTTRSHPIVIAAVLAGATAAIAATATQQPAPGTTLDPDAVAALTRMGAFLRAQQSFLVRTTTQTDYVLATGQKIRLAKHGELRVRRPDHLRADVVSDRKERHFYYDGKTFTMSSPQLGFYATVPAPATILQLADRLRDHYGLELPMVDLFRWGTPESDSDELTAGFYVGPTTVDGVACDLYAFRQPGLDWQIWIERGDHPVPRKLVLTTTDDPARPDVAIDMKWELGARFDDSVFAFVPGPDSKKITLAELPAARAAARSTPQRTHR